MRRPCQDCGTHKHTLYAISTRKIDGTKKLHTVDGNRKGRCKRCAEARLSKQTKGRA